jgi:hypothetical protein
MDWFVDYAANQSSIGSGEPLTNRRLVLVTTSGSENQPSNQPQVGYGYGSAKQGFSL